MLKSIRESNEDPIPRALSLYAHIPFCFSPCFYCGCNRVITRSRSEIGAYLVRLEREIALQAALFDRDRQVLQLHLGGGTPNYLDLEQMAALMDALGLAGVGFVGHALGGMIGLDLALRHGRVAKLVVVNGWLALDPHTARCFDVRLDILRSSVTIECLFGMAALAAVSLLGTLPPMLAD